MSSSHQKPHTTTSTNNSNNNSSPHKARQSHGGPPYGNRGSSMGGTNRNHEEGRRAPGPPPPPRPPQHQEPQQADDGRSHSTQRAASDAGSATDLAEEEDSVPSSNAEEAERTPKLSQDSRYPASSASYTRGQESPMMSSSASSQSFSTQQSHGGTAEQSSRDFGEDLLQVNKTLQTLSVDRTRNTEEACAALRSLIQVRPHCSPNEIKFSAHCIDFDIFVVQIFRSCKDGPTRNRVLEKGGIGIRAYVSLLTPFLGARDRSARVLCMKALKAILIDESVGRRVIHHVRTFLCLHHLPTSLSKVL